jgi:hemerythrin-like domain-containing protein
MLVSHGEIPMSDRTPIDPSRRNLIVNATALVMGAASLPAALVAEQKEPEVTATEDLMREHGVLRRALLVYHSAAEKLRTQPKAVDPQAIVKTATLFRDFGENYHERMLEEKYIFPVVRKATGPAAKYPDILVAQHQRGREITDYILLVAKRGTMGTNDASAVAQAMDALVLMYQHHAAREDTIVFPEWKKHFTEKQLDEFNDKFEDIEHKMFGKDGFDDAVDRIAAVEQVLGIADISQFTAPMPPELPVKS